MAALTVAAHDREPIDALVWRVTGQGSAAVDRVIDANRGLAALGPNLPQGTLVTIPEIDPAPAEIELVQLWD